MKAQALAALLMSRAASQAASEPDPRSYWENIVAEILRLHKQVTNCNDEAKVIEQLMDFGARLGLLDSTSPLEVN